MNVTSIFIMNGQSQHTQRVTVAKCFVLLQTITNISFVWDAIYRRLYLNHSRIALPLKKTMICQKLENEEIAARSHNLEDGVNCQGCHLTMDCTLAGPHAGVAPHPTEKIEKFYKRSELCGVCHKDTLKEYLTYIGEGDETCQDCHMPAVKRKLIQNEPWQKIHVRKEGKAHTFSSLSAIEKNRDFVELKFTEISNDNNQISGNVEIINSKVSHSIPTGKYGYRELLLLINLKDNLGRVIKSSQESMFVELDTQLKPGEKKIYSFAFELDEEVNGVKEIEAVLFRTNFDRTDKTQFAKVELQLALQ